MHHAQKVNDDLFWVGTVDRRLELFENLFPIPYGVSYNSYVLVDEKTVLFDTVDSATNDQYLENIKAALGGRKLDYLVIHHMEPDHCGSIPLIVKTYPDVQLVGNEKTFNYMKAFYEFDLPLNLFTVKEGDTLSLGKHQLLFVMMPMVHWPEVMVSYETTTKTLFSADAFGSFGALEGVLFADEIQDFSVWESEMRRYYANIVGIYGDQVQAALKKLGGVDIQLIAPLHGPLWRKDLETLLKKYTLWSSYTPEEKGVVICYGSMYGNTELAANMMASQIGQEKKVSIKIHDISKSNSSYIVSDIWKYSHVVFLAPTYNHHLYPQMSALFSKLKVVGFQNRQVALVGNYTWASQALNQMKEAMANFKNITLLGEVDIHSSLKENTKLQIENLAKIIVQSL